MKYLIYFTFNTSIRSTADQFITRNGIPCPYLPSGFGIIKEGVDRRKFLKEVRDFTWQPIPKVLAYEKRFSLSEAKSMFEALKRVESEARKLGRNEKKPGFPFRPLS